MVRKQKRIQGTMAAAGLLILILDSSLALEGASAGVELCIRIVIPSLFPFFVLSLILTSVQQGSIYLSRILSGLLGIPENAQSVVIPAVLGGYPVGAKCVGDLYNRKQISRDTAERLLAFCSNAGPSFLFGMVSGFFPERTMIWLLWGIHLFSAAMTAISLPVHQAEKTETPLVNKPEEGSVILSAAKAMCLVCCWVILFRILIVFLKEWFLWMLPQWAQVLLMGMLELTNGCCELQLVSNVQLRFVLCSCMLAFGGVCVLLQTISVTKGLSLVWYLKGKLLQTVFSLLLSLAAVSKQGPLILTVIPVLIMLLRKKQNRYSNLRRISV